jgi:nitroreductase
MDLRGLVIRNRSYRRFHQEIHIDRPSLLQLLDLARHSPSAGNLQPLKYMLSYDHERNSQIFPHLRWAAYFKDWHGPSEGERPSAYIIMLGDTTLSKSFDRDLGIAAQTILLGATEKGFGGCIIANIIRKELRKALDISQQYQILAVIALGKPKEEVKIETVDARGDIKYWRDDRGIHHVPKRPLEEMIIN